MTPDQHKAASRLVFDVWSTGEVDRLDAIVAPDVLHHDPDDPNAAAGLAGMKTTIAATRRAFPDLTMTVHDQVAEGDRVATRWTADMTARSGEPIAIRGMTLDRFEDGRIAEGWRFIVGRPAATPR